MASAVSSTNGVVTDEEESENQPHSSLLTCSFNQDGGCLAIGTTTGFSVHNLHPQYAVSVRRDLQGGIGLVEMLFRCNLMALVGGGPSPQAPPHRVLIWDDHLPKEIGELSFRQVVLSIKLRKDAIAVALRDRVYVYHLADLSLRDKIYTCDNPHGLLCLSTQIQNMVLACPSVSLGHVRVELYGLRKTQLMEAHESDLRGLALTADGSKLATASVKGTVIRVWDVSTGACIQEFRRGVERATITCLCWSWDFSWLSCASDKGTCHVFKVGDDENKNGNNQSSTGQSKSLTTRLFSSVIRSVEGEAKKSVCQVRGVPHPLACAFVSEANNLLAVAGFDADGNGVLLLSEFAAGEEPRRVGYHVLCKTTVVDESEEARRRRRMRGWTPQVPETPEGGRLYVGERLDIFEERMQQIQFDDNQEEEFVSVTTVKNINQNESNGAEEPTEANGVDTTGIDDKAKQQEGSNIADSMRTEDLEDSSSAENVQPEDTQ
ncbi:phosphoinositide-interacting protein 3 [Seminavis robusta]|uniref:Phosphoinositide-interacting protein 3 n=1 Tax=Seminavis robusta TaxID=568900 RepID=A0A9N8HV87_9STRA|nr:phosphoinositide-interacting protein 3 [Seminavis robusta]|eukprot:Sro2268_g321330.1 phosphoinositide-interacting protein 3 (491) ;mRNA; r:11400-13144